MKRIATATILLVLLLVTACTQYIYVSLPRPDKNEVVSLTVTETVLVEVNGNLPSTVKATAEYENGNEREVTATVIGTIDTSTQGVKSASAEYDDVRTTFDVTVYETGNVSTSYENLTETLNKASENDIIIVDGEIEFETDSNELQLKSGMRIIGTEGTKISSSRAGSVFSANGDNIEISNIEFESNLSAGSDIRFIYYSSGADGLNISNCTFTGTYDVTNTSDNFVSRGILVQPGAGTLDIDGCTFENIRQPAYIEDGVSGTIRNCTITGTRGWVIGSGTNLEFENNSFINNAVDIAIIDANKQGAAAPNNYLEENCISISQANGNCYVQNQITKINVRGNQVSHYE